MERIKTFKEFIHGITLTEEQLLEELNEYQKKLVSRMPDMTYSARQDHDAVFGKGNERIVVPYDDSKDPPIGTHNSVHEVGYNSSAHKVISLLGDYGYRVDDYEGGLTYHQDTPNRKIKIGKALDAIGKGGELSPITSEGKHEKKNLTWKQAYEADPMRSAKGSKQLVYSRDREDVAGMSSGRGWRSCMTLAKFPKDKDAGSNTRYVPHDLEHGTLTAYLTRVGDDKAEKPIGRVNIKQFKSGKHVIYRAENSSYGTFRPNIKKAVHAWAENNYPSNPGLYAKHPALYDDDGSTLRVEKPDEMTSHGFKQLRESISGSMREASRAGKEAAQINVEKGDWEAWGNHHDNMINLADKLLDMGSDSHKIEHQVHLLADHIGDHDQEMPDHLTDTDTSELSGDDYLHNAALNVPKQNSINQIKTLPTSKALELHGVLHRRYKSNENHGSFDITHSVHSELINHIMRNGTSDEKNSVLSDMTGPDDDTNEHYRTMLNYNHSIFDNHHPVELTTNPRKIHSLLDSTPDHFPVSDLDSDAIHHIGKHTDEKLAHELWNGDLRHHLDDNDGHEYFVGGMNENSHGEKIQHSLTDGMLFTGGHVPEQERGLPTQAVTKYMTHEVRSGKYYRDLSTERDLPAPYIETVPHSLRRDRNTGGLVNVKEHPSIGTIDAHDTSDDVDKFATIAGNTKFHSVFHKLKNRYDTKDVPAVKNAIADHPLFESTKTLKQFIAEAKCESKRSITGDAIKGLDRKARKDQNITMKPSKEKTEIDIEPDESQLLTHDLEKKE